MRFDAGVPRRAVLDGTELGALLSKETLIPVLHNVTFEDVKQYSGILPDLAGFTTAQDSLADIAKKIAAAILVVDDLDE